MNRRGRIWVSLGLIGAAAAYFAVQAILDRRILQVFQDKTWWETATPEEGRNLCHRLIRRDLAVHDAVLTLHSIGNQESVPLLLGKLESTIREGNTLCIRNHCKDALEAVTGKQFGYDVEQWKKWWKESGLR